MCSRQNGPKSNTWKNVGIVTLSWVVQLAAYFNRTKWTSTREYASTLKIDDLLLTIKLLRCKQVRQDKKDSFYAYQVDLGFTISDANSQFSPYQYFKCY